MEMGDAASGFFGKTPARPTDPSPDIHPKRRRTIGPFPLLLIKPGRTLDGSLDRGLGHPQPIPAEMVAEKVEAYFDPANECLVRVQPGLPGWVKSGSPARASECLLLGVKRTSNWGGWMSAFSQERTFAAR